jgi:hypothetical protein
MSYSTSLYLVLVHAAFLTWCIFFKKTFCCFFPMMHSLQEYLLNTHFVQENPFLIRTVHQVYVTDNTQSTCLALQCCKEEDSVG